MISIVCQQKNVSASARYLNCLFPPPNPCRGGKYEYTRTLREWRVSDRGEELWYGLFIHRVIQNRCKEEKVFLPALQRETF